MKFCYYQLAQIVLILLTITNTRPTIVRRQRFDATLYENYEIDGKFTARYSESKSEDWKDFEKLIENHQMVDSALLCTRGFGSWIVYPGKNYQVTHGLFYQLIVGENCVPAKMIKSAQPLGKINSRQINGVIAYTERHFGSEPTFVEKLTNEVRAKSLVYIGDKNWTLTAVGANGPVDVCIGRYLHDDDKICVLPELDEALGIHTAIQSITEGCNYSSSSSNVFFDLKLETCYGHGVHKITEDHDFNLPAMTSICNGLPSRIIPSRFKEKFTHVMEIWEARINKKIESRGESEIAMPTPISLKSDLLWQFIEVFKMGCPLVDIEFVNLLRNVFLIHMRTAWKEASTLIVEDSSDNYSGTFEFLKRCLAKTEAPSFDSPPLMVSCASGRNSILSSREADAFEEMVEGDTYDTVIENIWLILNFVSAYCNDIHGFKDNEWSDFVSLFRQIFLLPVENQWMKPGEWLQYYPSMFSGHDLDVNRRYFLYCVKGMQAKTPAFNPVGRTAAFIDNNRFNANITRPGDKRRKYGARIRSLLKYFGK